MRATEAIWLSQPENGINADVRAKLTHIEYGDVSSVIKAARRENRKTIQYKPQDASCAGKEAAL